MGKQKATASSASREVTGRRTSDRNNKNVPSQAGKAPGLSKRSLELKTNRKVAKYGAGLKGLGMEPNSFSMKLQENPVLKKLRDRARRESVGDKPRRTRSNNQWDPVLAARGLRNFYVDAIRHIKDNEQLRRNRKKLLSQAPARYHYAEVYGVPHSSFNNMVNEVEDMRQMSTQSFPWSEKQFVSFVDLFRQNLTTRSAETTRGSTTRSVL